MAPGFLSKFQKQPNSRNLSFSRSPSPNDQPSIVKPSIKSSSRTQTPDPDNLSVHSTNPSVTIGVIPPSPTVHSDASFPKDDPPASKPESIQDRRSEQRPPALSFSVAHPPKQDAPVDDPLITPTPGKGGAGLTTRALNPSSSTGDLRQFVQQAEAHSPGPMLFGESSNASSSAIQRQASEKSNRSQTVPAPIPIGHGKAATASSSGTSYDTITPTTSSSGGDDSGILSGMSPISESPTNMRTFTASPPQSPAFDPISRTQTQQTLNASLLTPGSKDSDSVSIISSNGEKKKSKWRRSSATKKPTGLAAAIAASGMAMANPAMTAPQIAQASQIQIASSSPPKQNGAHAQQHRKHSRHIASASAASLDAPKRSRARTGSISNRSDNSEAMYDSGLEGISSDEDDSGSEDELDLNDDIPVTGFAVASNKRNADFHELFSNIPEGDYLIEGGCDYLSFGGGLLTSPCLI